VKTSRPTRPSSRLDRSVAWWSVLLLIALATVLAALFLSARLMLSLANEDVASAHGRASHTFATVVLLPRYDTPNRSEPSPLHWWRLRELC
jgi:hypothetical protein